MEKRRRRRRRRGSSARDGHEGLAWICVWPGPTRNLDGARNRWHRAKAVPACKTHVNGPKAFCGEYSDDDPNLRHPLGGVALLRSKSLQDPVTRISAFPFLNIEIQGSQPKVGSFIREP